MEIVSPDGFATQIKPGQTRELGRSNGLDSSDKTISRCHVSFSIPRVADDQQTVARFQVLGRNPIYVSKGNDDVKIVRRFEKGEMGIGDMFCVSAKSPVWYSLRRVEECGEGVRRNALESELCGNLDGVEGGEDLVWRGVDVEGFDAVKEFGFVVMGREFESYPKGMVRRIEDWDWFLEEPGKDEDDDGGKKRKRGGVRKRKKGGGDDEEEWTGESEDEREVVNKSVEGRKKKYVTRSKDRSKPSKDTSKSKGHGRKKSRCVGDEDEDNEDDETLGGFIVDEEEEVGDEEEDEDEDDEEEEEEEFVDDEEDE